MVGFLADVFLIPFQAYFTPKRFLARVNTEVPAHFSFFEAVSRGNEVRRKATRFLIKILVSMMVIPLGITIIAWFMIPNANLPYMLLGAVSSLALGIAFGILPRVLFYFSGGMAGAIGFGVVFGSVFAVLLGVYSSLAGSTSPDAIAAAVDSPAGKMANAILLGATLGIVIRIFIGTLARDVRQTMLVGLILVIPFAILMSLFSKPDVLVTNRMAAVFAVAAFTGWFVLPIQLLIGVVNVILVRSNPNRSPSLWRISPVNWDDFLIVPMPDTVPLLIKLYDVDRDLYRKAFERVRQHTFQSRFANTAQQQIINA